MNRVIINADDFGLSHEVNVAICECFKKGFITNTTLMVNMPLADEAVYLAKQNGFFDKVGIHLNLTEGSSLTQNIRKSSLFYNANNDCFNGKFDQNNITRLFLSSGDRKAVSEELDAQIVKYLEYGFSLKHVDSHHHVHADLSILLELMPLVQKYRIRSMRLSRNIILQGVDMSKRIYKKLVNRFICRFVPISVGFFGDFYDYVQEPDLIIDEKEIVLELMCHPNYENGKIINRAIGERYCLPFDEFLTNITKYNLISYTEL